MKLFIIGNGFDLNLGLDTKLSSFGKYLKHNELELYYSLDSFHNLINWNDFERNLGEFDLETVIETNDFNWKQLDYYDQYKTYNDNFHQFLEENINEEISYIKIMLITHLKDWLPNLNFMDMSEEDEDNFIKFGRNNKRNVFLTFNYTTVLEEVFYIPEKRVHHIHGSLENPKGIILGHNSDFKFPPTKPGDVNELKVVEGNVEDYLTTFNKKCEDRVKDFFEFLKSNNVYEISQIIVLGHSLSEVDEIYFNEIHSKFPLSKWIFSTFNEDDKNRVKVFVKNNNISNYEFTCINGILNS